MTRSAALRPLLALALVAPPWLSSGCASDAAGSPPPTDQPSFPTGLAVHPGESVLAVVSSNFDLGFERGALLLADLERVDAALADATEPVVIEDAYVEAAFIPSFGNEPVFSADGERLVLATRDENLLIELDVDVSDGAISLSCGAPAAGDQTPVCGQAPRALTVPGSDPFGVALTSESEQGLSGIVGSLLSDRIVFFEASLEDGEVGLQRVDELVLGGWLGDDEEVTGVRAVAVRPAQGGVPRTAFALVERTADNPEGVAVDLVWFDPSRGRRATVRTLSLTNEAGSISARDLALTSDGDALLVLLRDPDGVARVELTEQAGVLAPRVSAVSSTCGDPVRLEVGRVPLSDTETRDRAFVTCFADDAVLGYNPLTLDVTEASRFFGDGPYDVALDLDRSPPRAYVSYHLDDSIGVFDLVTDGAPSLTPRGRIGAQHPIDERGVR